MRHPSHSRPPAVVAQDPCYHPSGGYRNHVFEVTPAWSGIFPAALTMFTRSGRLDEAGTADHLDSLIRQGVSGLVVGGTSGEFIALTDAERRRLMHVAVEAAAHRVPVIVGAGHYSTAETIRLCRIAEHVRADGVIVILPYYQRPSAAETVAHYRQVGRAARLPVMLYNNPANANAIPLDAEAMATLHRDGYASAVKSTFPTVHQVHELRAVTPPSFRVFYGSFMAPLEGLAGGAHGWISGILNVVTPRALALWRAMERGDMDAARSAWQGILPIKLLWTRDVLGGASDLAIYRGILRLHGRPGGYCRRPLVDLSAAKLRRLERHLRDVDWVLDPATSAGPDG